jgi:hypothetical protein
MEDYKRVDYNHICNGLQRGTETTEGSENTYRRVSMIKKKGNWMPVEFKRGVWINWQSFL